MIAFDFKLSYFDNVETDIEDAKYWYYDQSPDTNLEERFADSIIAIIHKIQKNPYIYHPIFENVRIAHPRFFPYCIYFTIDENKKTIIIIGILHSKQDISKLIDRIY